MTELLKNTMKCVNKILILFIVCILFATTTHAGKVNYKMKSSCASNSMAPAMTCKDMLTINTVGRYDNVTINNVYCYNPDHRVFKISAGYYICHRLINIIDDLYYFHGDNNGKFYDPPVNRKYIAWEIVNITKVIMNETN